MNFSDEQEEEFQAIATSLRNRKKTKIMWMTIYTFAGIASIWLFELPAWLNRDGGYILAGFMFTFAMLSAISEKNEAALYKLLLVQKQ